MRGVELWENALNDRQIANMKVNRYLMMLAVLV